jgi:HEAT repeat protein
MAEYSFPDFHYQAPNLDVPDPPAGFSYAEFGDYYNRELLRLNGIELSDEALIAALTHPSSMLQAAAAHTIGSRALKVAAPALRQALAAADDLTGVEAACALARLGDPEGKSVLVAYLDRAVPAYLSPLLAAGYLAQLGDPRGFPVIVHTLGLKSLGARMLACKQLFFFIPFHDEPDARGAVIDVVAQFQRMLVHPEADLRWQALIELRSSRAPAFIALLPQE